MYTYKNYATMNKAENPSEKNWCISVRDSRPTQQAQVMLNNGKKYSYVSRFRVQIGNVAVIGNGDRSGSCCDAYVSDTTGEMGQVTEKWESVMIKTPNPTELELDFVFSDEATKENVSACARYLSKQGNEKTLQNNAYAANIYPITFLIRKILAAASVLAFPELASAQAKEKAKKYICSPQVVDRGMTQLAKAWPEFADIDLRSIQVDIGGENEKELAVLKEPDLIDGVFKSDGWDDRNFDPELNAYVNKYVYIGAVSVMVRGGFANLLRGFLSANPPIGEFYDEMLRDLGSFGDASTLSILKEYLPD